MYDADKKQKELQQKLRDLQLSISEFLALTAEPSLDPKLDSHHLEEMGGLLFGKPPKKTG